MRDPTLASSQLPDSLLDAGIADAQFADNQLQVRFLPRAS